MRNTTASVISYEQYSFNLLLFLLFVMLCVFYYWIQLIDLNDHDVTFYWL